MFFYQWSQTAEMYIKMLYMPADRRVCEQKKRAYERSPSGGHTGQSPLPLVPAHGGLNAVAGHRTVVLGRDVVKAGQTHQPESQLANIMFFPDQG